MGGNSGHPPHIHLPNTGCRDRPNTDRPARATQADRAPQEFDPQDGAFPASLLADASGVAMFKRALPRDLTVPDA